MMSETQSNPAPGYEKKSEYNVEIESSPRWVRVKFGGETIADTKRALLIRETQHVPVYYFHRDDVRLDLLTPTETSTFCPFKGNASYWSIAAGGKSVEDAVWSYESPYDEAMGLAGYMAFYWNKMDHWYEEDEEIFVHPRDPHKRIDAIASTRHVQVILGGETIADSSRPVILYETNLPPRYYLPAPDVCMDLFSPTDSRTSCPYKGDATYWSAEIAGETFEDIVWSYPEPIPECPKIKGLLCFYNENVDQIIVDGEPIDRVATQWSNRYAAETLDGPEHIV
jgi:uncharacterized protein (DUF427 family)